MPSLKAIRTRIASVKNTQKITKAMKLVSAARLRRAQEAMMAARPYAKRLAEVIADISARGKAASGGAEESEASHPLLTQRPIQRARIIVIGSDRGLAGGYNSNLNRKVERYIIDEKPRLPQVDLIVVGRKAREHFTRRKGTIVGEHPAAVGDTVDSLARKLAEDATAAFLSTSEVDRVDAVYVAFNEFGSAISQVPTIVQVLPVPEPAADPQGSKTDPKVEPKNADGSNQLDFEYEPSKEAVLATALPLYLEVSIRRMLLDAVASEFGARMSAMDNATKNAKEMISSLTLVFNRARQASITKELMEIVGGAEALKG